MFSRNGYIPTCANHDNKYQPKFLEWNYILNTYPSQLTAKKFIDLIIQENNEIGNKSEYLEATKALKSGGAKSFLSCVKARAIAAETPFQDALISTRTFMHRLWRSLNIQEREWFQTNYGARWAAWRHPIPTEVIEELHDAIDEGRLQFLVSNKRPTYREGQYHLETSEKLVRSTYFIDGTGGNNNLASSSSVLVRNLINNEMIKKHPNGGIDINPITYKCRNERTNRNNLYSIGPINKGSLFSTNAYWFNSRCAYLWARNHFMQDAEISI